MIELFLAGLQSQGNKRARGARAQGDVGQAVAALGGEAILGPEPPEVR